MGGHSGINATLSKVSTLYHWNGMKEDIQEYVSNVSLKSNYDAVYLHMSVTRLVGSSTSHSSTVLCIQDYMYSYNELHN